MVSEASLYIFGDAAHDLVPELHKLLRLTQQPFLKAFFDGAYEALRAEVACLSASQREQFPRFTSVHDLLFQHESATAHPAMHIALVNILHLGTYIRLINVRQIVGGNAPSIYLQGLGLGSLAAAAVASACSMSDLLKISLHAVRTAFRAGLRASDVARSVEVKDADSDKSSSWALEVLGISTNQARVIVDDFNNDKVNSPRTSRINVTFSADHKVIIGGAPSSLTAFQASRLRKFESRASNSHVPAHSTDLFSKRDIDTVLNAVAAQEWAHYECQVPILSSSTGRFSAAPDYASQMKAALTDFLVNPISWHALTHGVSTLAGILPPKSQLTLHPIGTDIGAILQADLSRQGFNVRLSGSAPHARVPSSTSPHPGRTAVDLREQSEYPSARSKIAIVGISGRFPEAEDLETFWKILSQGLDVHKVVPPTRWSAATHVDPSGKRKNTSATPYGCWLNNPGHFDTKFFGMSPREAAQVDPASRLALMTAYEAMEQAGMVPNSTPSTLKDRVGVLYGVTSNDWMEVNSAQNIDTCFIPGGCRAFIPGRINYFFKFSGLSSSIDTACSSSLSAVHAACNALWQKDIDTAIVGGTNVLTNPDYTAGLDRGHFLSRTGNCKSFDNEADGYCRGEGVCTIVLKRLEDALAENDPIQGVILGAYTNHSAEAESITRPLMQAQRDIFSKILNDANVHPLDVSYVEMHGTGTQAGDPVEMNSVASTFSPTGLPWARSALQPLHVGSVKSNVGHGEAAAGVTSLAKVLLMMRNNSIPPHCGIKTKLNENFPPDLEQRHLHVARTWKPWRLASNGGTRKAFINNFSAAGGNSALLIEDAPSARPRVVDSVRTSHMVAVSAKSQNALRENLQALISHIDASDGNLNLADLSYTTTARRMHHPLRVMAAGATISDIRTQLHSLTQQQLKKNTARSKVLFAFTGNGSQYPGMGHQLYETFPSFREHLHHYDSIAVSQGFPSALDFCTASKGKTGDFDVVVVHLATLCLEMALARLWMSWGVAPDAVVGHSLGEYAALNVAGVLSDADAIYVVGKRAELLKRKCEPGAYAMLAVRASANTLKTQVGTYGYEFACYNGPEDVVLSGRLQDLKKIQGDLSRRQIRSTILQVPYAFHSVQMDPILDDLTIIGESAKFSKPAIPVICPAISTIVNDVGVFSPSYLSRHTREPVDIAGSLLSAKQMGIVTPHDLVLEIGPQPIVGNIVKRVLGSLAPALPSLKENEDVWPMLAATLSSFYLSGHDINWREYHSNFVKYLRTVELPTYKWDLKDYWIQYVNDWSLRKGDPWPPVSSPLNSNVANLHMPRLQDALIQKVLEDKLDGSTGVIVIQLDLLHADIRAISQGHKVNNIPLVTPSFYTDIAARVGRYIVARYQPNSKDALSEISEMTIQSALTVPDGNKSQLLEAKALFDVSKTTSIKLEFYSPASQEIEKKVHSHCRVDFTERAEALRLLQGSVTSARAAIGRLQQECLHGEAFRFSNKMIYKIVGSLAQFTDNYRQVNEIVLNSSSMEASSTVTFKDDPKDLGFSSAVDALSQSAGFVMNGNEEADLEKEVFVNHGWSKLQLFEVPVANRKYQTYIQLKEQPGKKWVGDLTVIDEEKIVAFFGGINLQGVPRRVLQYILSDSTAGYAGSLGTGAVNAAKHDAAQLGEIVRKQTHQSHQTRHHSGIHLEPRLQQQDQLPRHSEEVVTHVTPTDASSSTAMPHQSAASGNGYSADMTTAIASSAPTLTVGATDSETLSIQTLQHAGTTSHKIPCEKYQRALSILSEETGAGVEEFTEDAVLADLGIDSLLSIVINARFREELSLDFPSSASVYTDFPTIKHLKDFLADGQQQSDEHPCQILRVPHEEASCAQSPGQAMAEYAMEAPMHLRLPWMAELTPPPTPPVQNLSPPRRSATSVILQGRFNSQCDTLFLFPDGGGSAASYANITPVSTSLTIIGLNCPYLRHPTELRYVKLDDLISLYIEEIRRRRPKGPYCLGGWSAGGILAYRAAQELIRQGEDIHNLVLLDAPPPRGLDRLPRRWYEYCSATNLFGTPSKVGASTPHFQEVTSTTRNEKQSLFEHFESNIEVLHNYVADPLPECYTPRVSIAWAGECVFDGVKLPKFPSQPGDPEGIKFLTEKRTDLTAGAWSPLFPGEKIQIECLEDANHFSMMSPQYGERLAQFIRRAVM